MRVLYVDRGGAHAVWRVLDVCAAALVAHGHEVIYCRLCSGDQRAASTAPEGVKVVDLESGASALAAVRLIVQHRAFARGFSALLRRERPDVVHTNFAVPGALARRMAKHAGVPVVVTTQHELYGSMSPHLRLAVRATERCADAVVYVSHAVARSFGRTADAAEDRRPRHLVIHNCVDADAIGRIAAGITRVPGRIVCAGRLVSVKGQATLLRALPAIAAAEPAAHLMLIGAGPDEARLKALAGELGLAERVTFAGWLSWEETVRAMAGAATVVAPSTLEGFGLVIAEAMAAGAPLVASDIPAFAEVMGADGDCGRRFRPGDAEALAAAVLDVLAAPQVAARQAERAQARVRERFTPERMAEAYLELYDDLLAGAGGGGREHAYA